MAPNARDEDTVLDSSLTLQQRIDLIAKEAKQRRTNQQFCSPTRASPTLSSCASDKDEICSTTFVNPSTGQQFWLTHTAVNVPDSWKKFE